MSNPYNLKVGQKLWYVPNDRRFESAREYTVKKVGRLFAELSGSRRRIRLDNLEVNVPNYGSPGRCYLSQEEYAAELERIARAQTLLFEGVE